MKKLLILTVLFMLVGCEYIDDDDGGIVQNVLLYNDQLTNYREHYEIMCDSNTYYSFDIEHEGEQKLYTIQHIDGEYNIYVPNESKAFYSLAGGAYVEFPFETYHLDNMRFLTLLTESSSFDLSDLKEEDDVEYSNLDPMTYQEYFFESIGIDVKDAMINLTFGFQFYQENKYISHGQIEIQQAHDLYDDKPVQSCEILYSIDQIDSVDINIVLDEPQYDHNVFINSLFYSEGFSLRMMTEEIYATNEDSPFYEEEVLMGYAFEQDREYYLLSVREMIDFEYYSPHNFDVVIYGLRGEILYDKDFKNGNMVLGKGLYLVSLEYTGDIDGFANGNPFKPLFGTNLEYADFIRLHGGPYQYLFEGLESIDFGYTVLEEIDLFNTSSNLDAMTSGQYQSTYEFSLYSNRIDFIRTIIVLPFEDYDERYDVLAPTLEITDYETFFVEMDIIIDNIEEIDDPLKIAIFDNAEMVGITDFVPNQTTYRFDGLTENVNYSIYLYAEYDGGVNHPVVLFRHDVITRSNPKVNLNYFTCDTEVYSMTCSFEIDQDTSIYNETDNLLIEVYDSNGNYVTNYAGRFDSKQVNNLEENSTYEVRLSKVYSNGEISLIDSILVSTKLEPMIDIINPVLTIGYEDVLIDFDLDVDESLTNEDYLEMQVYHQNDLIERIETIPLSESQLQVFGLMEDTEYTITFYQVITSVDPNSYQRIEEITFQTPVIPPIEYSFGDIATTNDSISVDYNLTTNKPSMVDNVVLALYHTEHQSLEELLRDVPIDTILLNDLNTTAEFIDLMDLSMYTVVFKYDILIEGVWETRFENLDTVVTNQTGFPPTLDIHLSSTIESDFYIMFDENESVNIHVYYEFYEGDTLIKTETLLLESQGQNFLLLGELDTSKMYTIKFYMGYEIEHEGTDSESYFEVVEITLVEEITFQGFERFEY